MSELLLHRIGVWIGQWIAIAGNPLSLRSPIIIHLGNLTGCRLQKKTQT